MSRANDRIWKYELARFEYSYKFEADFGLERREESKSKTEGSRRMLLFNVILHLHCFAMFGTAISGDSGWLQPMPTSDFVFLPIILFVFIVSTEDVSHRIRS